MSDKTFDPNIILEAIPSFYRTYLPAEDQALLGHFWTGVIRIVDAEYARLFQASDSTRVKTASALSTYPWIYQEFQTWESRGAHHQHRVIRLPGSAAGKFYLGRYFDTRFLKVYYAGSRQEILYPSIITNELDAAQYQELLFGTGQPIGTRIEMRSVSSPGVIDPSAAFGNPSNEVVVEAERELHKGLVVSDGTLSQIEPFWFDENDAAVADQTIDPDQARASVASRHLNATAGYSIDNVNAQNPVLTWATGFKAGQMLQILRADGTLHEEPVTVSSTTHTIAKTKTDSGGSAVSAVFLKQGVQLYPSPVVVEAAKLVFSRPLPVGLRVRVTDPAGTQSFEVDRSRTTFALSKAIKPDAASVFVYSIDLLSVTADAGGFSFGRSLEAGCVVDFEAPLVFGHDHARHSIVQVTPGTTVALPLTRPLALNADLTESPRYPVKVFLNGLLLHTDDYIFNSTVEIELTSGTFIKGDRIDVVYTDAEDNEAHIHYYDLTRVDSGVTDDVVVLPEPVEPDRYPITVEVQGSTLIPAANLSIALNQYVQLEPLVTGPATVFTEGVVRGLNYRTRLPTRIDEPEHYVGTLQSAESLQSGIDLPAYVSSGDGLVIRRDGDETVVEADVAYTRGWFKNARVDEHLVDRALGIPISYRDRGESTQRYRDVVMALYSAYRRGSQLSTLENFGCIVLGSAFAERAGSDKGVVSLDGQGRVRRVEDATGSVVDVALHQQIPDRVPPATQVPVFFAASAYCTVNDRNLLALPWLAFFAESVSDDYSYAKRIDVRVPYVHTGDVEIYDSVTGILTDTLSDFVDLEVWPSDLIKLTTTGNTQGGLSIASVTAYARVLEVLSETQLRITFDLESEGYGWGEIIGWGSTTGWGGGAGADQLDTYTIWTRRTRRLDTYKFLDEALDQSQALADGESVQRINEMLVPILQPFIFTVKIDWFACRSVSALSDLKTFFDTAKAAETGYFAYVEVNNDDGLSDLVSGAVVARDPEVIRDGRYTFVGEDYIESMYIAPDTELVGIGDASFDGNWWDPGS